MGEFQSYVFELLAKDKLKAIDLVRTACLKKQNLFKQYSSQLFVQSLISATTIEQVLSQLGFLIQSNESGDIVSLKLTKLPDCSLFQTPSHFYDFFLNLFAEVFAVDSTFYEADFGGDPTSSTYPATYSVFKTKHHYISSGGSVKTFTCKKIHFKLEEFSPIIHQNLFDQHYQCVPVGKSKIQIKEALQKKRTTRSKFFTISEETNSLSQPCFTCTYHNIQNNQTQKNIHPEINIYGRILTPTVYVFYVFFQDKKTLFNPKNSGFFVYTGISVFRRFLIFNGNTWAEAAETHLSVQEAVQTVQTLQRLKSLSETDACFLPYPERFFSSI